MLDLRQLLLGDAELQRTVDLVRVTHGSPHVVRSHHELNNCVTGVQSDGDQLIWGLGILYGLQRGVTISITVFFVIEVGFQVQLLLEKLPLLHGVPGILRWMYRYIDRLLDFFLVSLKVYLMNILERGLIH